MGKQTDADARTVPLALPLPLLFGYDQMVTVAKESIGTSMKQRLNECLEHRLLTFKYWFINFWSGSTWDLFHQTFILVITAGFFRIFPMAKIGPQFHNLQIHKDGWVRPLHIIAYEFFIWFLLIKE